VIAHAPNARYPRETFAQVAETYRAAVLAHQSDPRGHCRPTMEVAARFGCSRDTAGYLVHRAALRGLLPVATRYGHPRPVTADPVAVPSGGR
jgi:hypothetical protein